MKLIPSLLAATAALGSRALNTMLPNELRVHYNRGTYNTHAVDHRSPAEARRNAKARKNFRAHNSKRRASK